VKYNIHLEIFFFASFYLLEEILRKKSLRRFSERKLVYNPVVILKMRLKEFYSKFGTFSLGPKVVDLDFRCSLNCL